MFDIKRLVLFLITIIYVSGEKKITLVNTNLGGYRIGGSSDCLIPDAKVHSCFTNLTYPTNKTTCHCLRNNKLINLVCIKITKDKPLWVRETIENPCYNDSEERTTFVYIRGNVSKAAHPICYEPRDVNVHSCTPYISYPSAYVTCKCALNNQPINLVCVYNDRADGMWVRQNQENSCNAVGSNQEKTAKIWSSKSSLKVAIDRCDRPEEELNWFHSCRKDGYPSEYTDCRCSNNFAQAAQLACYKQEWYFYKTSWNYQCGDKIKNSIAVHLYYYSYVANKTCNSPLEDVNVFHSCDKKNYTTNKTTCTCTYNAESKLELICDGNKWLKYGPDQPCKYNFLPHLVRCYKDKTTDKVVCNCISNCFPLNITRQPSFEDIYRICSMNYRTHRIQEKNLKLYFNRSSSTVHFVCDDNYILSGSKHLYCYYGQLRKTLPECRQADFLEINCNTINGSKKVCRCVNSCVYINRTLGSFKKNTHEEILGFCNDTKYQSFGNLHITYEDRKLKYECDNWYKLNGPNEIDCNMGNINTMEPKCEFNIQQLLNSIFIPLCLLLLVIFSISIYFDFPWKYFKKRKTANIELGTINHEEPEYDDPDLVRPRHARQIPEYMDMDTDDPPDLPERPPTYDEVRPLPLEDKAGYLEPRPPAPAYDYVYMHLHPNFRFKNRIGIIKRNSF